jgi:hypothetical protein
LAESPPPGYLWHENRIVESGVLCVHRAVRR